MLEPSRKKDYGKCPTCGEYGWLRGWTAASYRLHRCKPVFEVWEEQKADTPKSLRVHAENEERAAIKYVDGFDQSDGVQDKTIVGVRDSAGAEYRYQVEPEYTLEFFAELLKDDVGAGPSDRKDGD